MNGRHLALVTGLTKGLDILDTSYTTELKASPWHYWLECKSVTTLEKSLLAGLTR